MAVRKSPDNPSAFRFVLSSSRSGQKADFHFQSILRASEIRSFHLQIPGNLIRVSTGFQFHSPYFPFFELTALRFLWSVRFRRFTLENLKQKTRDFSLAVVQYRLKYSLFSGKHIRLPAICSSRSFCLWLLRRILNCVDLGIFGVLT